MKAKAIYSNDSDYDRFLRGAGSSKAHIERIVDRLLAEKTISRAVADALLSETMHVVHDAYQAGRCEPASVTDLIDELARCAP